MSRTVTETSAPAPDGAEGFPDPRPVPASPGEGHVLARHRSPSGARPEPGVLRPAQPTGSHRLPPPPSASLRGRVTLAAAAAGAVVAGGQTMVSALTAGPDVVPVAALLPVADTSTGTGGTDAGGTDAIGADQLPPGTLRVGPLDGNFGPTGHLDPRSEVDVRNLTKATDIGQEIAKRTCGPALGPGRRGSRGQRRRRPGVRPPRCRSPDLAVRRPVGRDALRRRHRQRHRDADLRADRRGRRRVGSGIRVRDVGRDPPPGRGAHRLRAREPELRDASGSRCVRASTSRTSATAASPPARTCISRCGRRTAPSSTRCRGWPATASSSSRATTCGGQGRPGGRRAGSPRCPQAHLAQRAPRHGEPRGQREPGRAGHRRQQLPGQLGHAAEIGAQPARREQRRVGLAEHGVRPAVQSGQGRLHGRRWFEPGHLRVPRGRRPGRVLVMRGSTSAARATASSVTIHADPPAGASTRTTGPAARSAARTGSGSSMPRSTGANGARAAAVSITPDRMAHSGRS